MSNSGGNVSEAMVCSLESQGMSQRSGSRLKIEAGEIDFHFAARQPFHAFAEINLHDATVQQVLNNIALNHGTGVWRYSESHCQNKNEFQIDWAVH
jgi:hypothetical protein